MANSGDESESNRGRAGMVIDTVSGVIVDAKGVVTPLPKAAAKELRKLEKGLAAARKTESKRLRQVAAAAWAGGWGGDRKAAKAGRGGRVRGRLTRLEDRSRGNVGGRFCCEHRR